MVGQSWANATVEAAALAVSMDFTPLTDMRAGSDYRNAVAANLLRRFWHESQGVAVTRIEMVKRVVAGEAFAP
jgi:xanthine dehydrogenase small subunit